MMRTFFLLLLGLLLACDPNPTVTDGGATTLVADTVDPYTIASRAGEYLNVIVEIPAGTNHKIEYHPQSGYVNDTLADGAQRVINFLPYPGNYGFVPSTLMDRARGGDGDALDVLVIGESVPTGTQLHVQPIATLLLRDRGEIDTKIIAVPAAAADRVYLADNFLDFSLGNDAAKRIIETWFLNYKGYSTVELLRWEDERYAWREVDKWTTDTLTIQ
ncbi:Inorganic pyrophosphatase [Neolewinella maritima]|uniref:inorganic diphosphatase n=1 Tax=Neolewinella maritima TaxID=1383882 RepID=A0ABN8F0T3_9BACT|nr:inorganic diphosphatase [Neolewinella maritima]CAH0999635.1 Inorganic pyrophosphatase [Neolewinella maritima]